MPIVTRSAATMATGRRVGSRASPMRTASTSIEGVAAAAGRSRSTGWVPPDERPTSASSAKRGRACVAPVARLLANRSAEATTWRPAAPTRASRNGEMVSCPVSLRLAHADGQAGDAEGERHAVTGEVERAAEQGGKVGDQAPRLASSSRTSWSQLVSADRPAVSNSSNSSGGTPGVSPTRPARAPSAAGRRRLGLDEAEHELEDDVVEVVGGVSGEGEVTRDRRGAAAGRGSGRSAVDRPPTARWEHRRRSRSSRGGTLPAWGRPRPA